MRKKLKKLMAYILSATMMIGGVSISSQIAKVEAAENTAVPSTYWIDVDGLKSFTADDANKTVGKIRLGQKDDHAIEWMIGGVDTDANNSLSLLSTKSFDKTQFGNSTDYSNSNFVKKIPTYLTANFTTAEQNYLVPISVRTEEYDNGNWTWRNSDASKLYLPNAPYNTYGGNYICIGTSNNIQLLLSKCELDVAGFNWLRTADKGWYPDSMVLIWESNGRVNDFDKFTEQNVVPACNLDISTVSFASAVPAVATAGEQNGIVENTFSLRYTADSSWDNINATVSVSGIDVDNANGKYLVVQNGDGAYAVAIDSDNKNIKTRDIIINGNALTNFNNCKVWIESTSDRITTAKLATFVPSDVTITLESNMSVASGSASQTGLLGDMTDTVITANTGFYFPADYVSTISGLTNGSKDGITVTRDSASQITISGTPTATTSITLPDSTAKSTQPRPNVEWESGKITMTDNTMEYVLKSNFDADNDTTWTICESNYTEVPAGIYYVRFKETDTEKASEKEVVNVHVKASEWNKDADNHWHECIKGDDYKFDEATHIYDEGVITTPATENSVGVKTYTCTTCGYVKTEDIPQLTHSHTPGTTWEKDANNHWHECTKGDGFKLDEAKHTYTDWTVTQEATETEQGSKYRTCEVCGYKDTQVIPQLAHTHKPGTEWKKDADNHWRECIKDDYVFADTKAEHKYSDNKDTTCDTCGYVRTVTPDPEPTPKYTILNGADSTFTIGKDESLVIRGDGAYSKFKEVKVDGVVVDKSNYSVEEGSTIITLKTDYLKGLKEGKHSFELVWEDGSAKTSFTIQKKSDDNTPPKKDDTSNTGDNNSPKKNEAPETGDNTPIGWLFALMMISGGTVVYLGRKRKTLK